MIKCKIKKRVTEATLFYDKFTKFTQKEADKVNCVFDPESFVALDSPPAL